MHNHFTITRTKDSEWCRLEIELRDRNGSTELSICGSAGRVVKPKYARMQAREYWESYFNEDWNYIKEMNEKNGTNFRSPKSAAKYVLNCDGEYHGVDADSSLTTDKLVYITECCGQIREELSKWFPEVIPLFPWHLNCMKSECQHQYAQGKTYATHPGDVCNECGTKLGAAWYTWTLPSEILQQIEKLREMSNIAKVWEIP